MTLGECVRVTGRGGDEFVGTAVDVDETGALLIGMSEGERRVTGDDCEKLRRE